MVPSSLARPGARDRPWGRFRGDSGAIVVEFALVAPVLVALLLVGYEGGVWFFASNRMAAGLSLAGRSDSNQGNARMADNAALASLYASSAGIVNLQVKYVIIYNAGNQTGTNAVPPSNTCIAKAHLITAWDTDKSVHGDKATPGAECNIFTWAQISATVGGNASPGFTGTATCAVSDWDSNWCPLGRKNGLTGATSPPDVLGVWVESDYRSSTGWWFNTKPVTDFAIFRVEPAQGS